MGKQSGFLNVRGKIGDVVFRQTADGFSVGRKTNLTGARLKSDPTFANTRKAMAEFGVAGKAGKLLRTAVLKPLSTAGDSKLSSRMLTVMYQVLKTDMQSKLGERKVQNGQMALLHGFEFNKNREIVSTFLVQYDSEIDRAAGKTTVSIESFVPNEVMLVPEEATHFKLFSGGCTLDFEMDNNDWGASESAYYTLGDTPVPAITLTSEFEPASLVPIVLVVGIRFYRLVNGFYNQLHGDKYDAMRLLKVDQP